MREIKFRFYCPSNGNMPYQSDCGVKLVANDLVEDEDWKVMQFTGLIDKNGKEIYECDIVDRCFADGEITGTVEWCKHRAGFMHVPFDTEKFGTGDSMTNISQFAVIGNIHQHGHLLDRGEQQ